MARHVSRDVTLRADTAFFVQTMDESQTSATIAQAPEPQEQRGVDIQAWPIGVDKCEGRCQGARIPDQREGVRPP